MSVNPYSRYQKASSKFKHRLLGRSAGEVGTGKTSFWLSGPAPIVIMSFDRGLEGVVEPFVAAGKEIYVAEYDWSPSPDEDFQAQAIELRDRYKEDFVNAINNARTVILDKETDLWELYRYAEFGQPNTSQQRDYAPLNQRYRQLINMTKSLDVNFGVIQGMKDEWGVYTKANGKEGNGPTGNRIPKGFDEMDGLVHLQLMHVREGNQISIEVGKVRGPGSRDIQGSTFTAMDSTTAFQEFAMAVFPDSEPEEWE